MSTKVERNYLEINSLKELNYSEAALLAALPKAPSKYNPYKYPKVAKFRRTTNAPAFLTPVRLVLGEQKISTTRGMTNIPTNDIRKFRLAKSSRFSQMKSSKFPESS